MSRFFVSPEQIIGNHVEIIGEDVKHISKVLRLEIGSEISVLDGTGLKYQVRIETTSKDKITGEILARERLYTEPPVNVNLIQGLPKGEKVDFIIQKCTELGINTIKLVNTERSVVKLDTKKVVQRLERWQKIATEAAEQSGRAIVPEILEVENLFPALQSVKEKGTILIPWEGETVQSLKNLLKENRKLYQQDQTEFFIVIGPEGGFSQREINKAMELGAIPVSLGPRILRTETAGLAALTMLLYELGDLGGR